MTIESFFNPSSVAVVGASREPGKTGHEVFASLVAGGFAGDIYPVNPKTNEIAGLKCYPDLRSCPRRPDLVVIVVPAKAVLGVMGECVSLGVKSVVIISAGFKETGEKGAELERELMQVARRGGIRVLGPNCIGLMAPARKLNASFGGTLPPPGGIGYFSQSGSLLAAIVDMASAEALGFSKLVSMGNKADIDELDLLRAFADDDETTVVAGYLETIANGDAFVKEAERLSHDKPVLLMKSGVTGAGIKAASSHTGRLAGSEQVYEYVFERAGIIRCDSIRSQFDFARAFANQPLPAGQRVVVVANAGGPAIMATDALESAGLTVAELSESTRKALAAKLPPAAHVGNPIDLLGDALADRYEAALEAVMDDPNADVVLVMLSPHAMTDCSGTGEAIARAAAARPGKPVLACFLGAERVRAAKAILRAQRIPVYDSPESAVAAIKVMADYARWRKRPKRVVKLFPVNRRKVEQIIDRCLRRGDTDIGELPAKEILDAYGFVTPPGSIATSAEQAANIAEQMGFPVVLKIWSPDILHKTAVGGVKIGLNARQEIMDAFDLMMYRIPRKVPDADILGVLVEEMVTGGQEFVLGMTRDQRFGPLMMFGVGGVMVELLKDVAFHLAPVTAGEAMEMLAGTRTYQLLKGGCGREGADIDAVAEGIQRLSQLVTENPQIQEMDINPYVVGPEGTTPIAVDARIAIKKT